MKLISQAHNSNCSQKVKEAKIRKFVSTMSKNIYPTTPRTTPASLPYTVLSSSSGGAPPTLPISRPGQRMTASRLNAIINEAIALIDDDDFGDDEQD